jgi:hypothetical protein
MKGAPLKIIRPECAAAAINGSEKVLIPLG